jgi:hypothetical protein
VRGRQILKSWEVEGVRQCLSKNFKKFDRLPPPPLYFLKKLGRQMVRSDPHYQVEEVVTKQSLFLEKASGRGRLS